MNAQQPQRGHLVLAVDLGTTSSSIAYVLVPEGKDPKDVSPCAIEMIENWPQCIYYGPGESKRTEIPTAVAYPRGWDFKTPCDPEPFPDIDMYMDDPELTGDDQDEAADDQGFTSPRWGYEVHRDLAISSTYNDVSKRPAVHFKPLFGLIESEEELRMDGTKSLENLHSHLQDRESIKVEHMYLRVTTDFLILILGHCKNEILKKRFELVGPTEVAICVLDVWSQKAFREMQSCMTVAMKRVGFPMIDIQDDSINKVFLVSEPEAAATDMLTNRGNVMPGDNFVITDAGGGTVDASTYTATRQSPLRIEKLVIDPTGDSCGSMALNQGVRELLHELLDSETYLEVGGSTIDGIIEALVSKDFEYFIKRTFNPYNTRNDYRLELRGLKGHRHQDFENSTIIIRAKELKRIFRDVFNRAGNVLIRQLRLAMEKGIAVQKVIIIGGFASHLSFIDFMTRRVEAFNKDFCQEIQVYVPEDVQRGEVINAVAKGAVLRALDKENGPEREARCSYGLVRYQKRTLRHGRQNGHRNNISDDVWVKTLHWVIQKGKLVRPNKTWKYKAMYQFPFHNDDGSLFMGPFDCIQDIFMSDTANTNNLDESHELNEDSTFVGTLEFSAERRIAAGLCQIRSPRTIDGVQTQVKHYEVVFEIHFIVQGLNLRCLAVDDGVILDELHANIAAGFLPSTE